MGRERFAKQSLGVLHGTIKTSKVLMVGAGGIGCELLKNLALTDFGEIHIVDLDTIDLSNLNRQFLFRHEHIKKSKALVAKETAEAFNPNVKIEAHHANIKDAQFNIEWFRGFTIVFNALDNLDARRHVNKMCLLADRPLVESGTTGFNGNVQVIKKGQTECYDCTAKEVPKTFPVCTIRSTPSQPIHCIVWAKSYLFAEIFGTSEFEEDKFDHSEDTENADEIKQLEEEAKALKHIRESMGSDDFARLVFEKVFEKDIERLRSMEDMWKVRKPPTSLNYKDLSQASNDIDPSVAHQDQKTWSLEENFVVFADSLKRLSAAMKKSQAAAGPDSSTVALTFDKDDENSLDFVASAANLRSSIFAIEMKSKFDVKQMAGNIIPAIATTNAMTAGLCVLQAFKVLKDQLGKSKSVFLERSTDRVFNTETLQPPNPNCTVCSKVSSQLELDTSRATLGNLVEDILKLKLGYSEDLAIRHEDTLLYDADFDDNLAKTFSDLSIQPDNFLIVVDEDENPRVDLSLAIVEKSFPEDVKPIDLPESLNIARKPKIVYEEANGAVTEKAVPTQGTKRQLEDDVVVDAQPSKKSKMSNGVSTKPDEAVIVEDAGDGAILIDD